MWERMKTVTASLMNQFQDYGLTHTGKFSCPDTNLSFVFPSLVVVFPPRSTSLVTRATQFKLINL